MANPGYSQFTASPPPSGEAAPTQVPTTPPTPVTPPPPEPITPVATAPTAPTALPAALPSEDWKSILPEDTRQWESVKNAKTPKDLMDTLGYYQSRAGRSINIPGQDASETDRTEFLTKLRAHVPELLDMPMPDDSDGVADLFTKLGKPTESAGYSVPEFEMVDGVNVNNEQLETFKTIAHKHNLTANQFKGVVQDFLGQQIDTSNQQQTEFNNGIQALADEWGQTFEPKIGKAQRIAEQFFPNSGLGQLIQNGQVGAGTLKDLEALGTQLGVEGQQLVGQQGGTGVNTPQELRDQAEELTQRILDAPPHQRQALIQKRIKLIEMANLTR